MYSQTGKIGQTDNISVKRNIKGCVNLGDFLYVVLSFYGCNISSKSKDGKRSISKWKVIYTLMWTFLNCCGFGLLATVMVTILQIPEAELQEQSGVQVALGDQFEGQNGVQVALGGPKWSPSRPWRPA